MAKSDYLDRIADGILDFKLKTFGAVNIVGPKWCGKTKTSLRHCKSKLMLQAEFDKITLRKTAEVNPLALLKGEAPRLIDEWQDVPVLWDAVRAFCDESGKKGCFILTGSTSRDVRTQHTGTGRISTMKMYPMSLFESLESNGSVSLSALFDGAEADCVSDLEIGDLVFAACRGGWPESVVMSDWRSQLEIPKDYFTQIYTRDLFSVDDVRRNPATMKAILRSYARNISTPSKSVSILRDVNSVNSISDVTLEDYISVLEKLFVVEDLYGWSPAIRSRSAIRCGRKREFADPSIAVAALGSSPEKLEADMQTFGFVFETLCVRDLRVYSAALGGELSYYHDKTGLEADCVLHLGDGRYALIEFRLGGSGIDEGAAHLCKIEALIRAANAKPGSVRIPLPDLKVVITGGRYGFTRKDGVKVVPIGCLRD